MITVKHLRCLVAIADKLHFRRAAEAMHVSQPTMSGQLREFEERLGVQLVERSRSRVILTPVGSKVVARARIILRDVDSIIEIAKQNQNLMDGMLRVGVIPTLGPYLIPHVLPNLRETYPKLKLYVRETMPLALLRDLEEGKLDLLFFPLPIREADFETARLFREYLWIVAPSDHPIAKKNAVEPSDLRGETILALERGHRLHGQVHELCEHYDAHVALDYEGTSLDTLRQMVDMGLGLSFLPALYVLSEVRNDTQIVVRKMKYNPPSRLIGMVWRRQSSRQAEFLALADLIRTIVQEKGEGGVTAIT